MQAAPRPLAPRDSVRTALLDATGALLEQNGYRKTSVEDIARMARVSRATAYLYFATKDDLIGAWMARSNARQLVLVQAEAQNAAPNATAQIAAFLLARILIRLDSAQPFNASIDEFLAALRPRVLQERDKHHEAEALALTPFLAGAAQNGEIAALADPTATARLLLLGTRALLPYSLSSAQLGERAQVETRARGLIALLMNGLKEAPLPPNKGG